MAAVKGRGKLFGQQGTGEKIIILRPLWWLLNFTKKKKKRIKGCKGATKQTVGTAL